VYHSAQSSVDDAAGFCVLPHAARTTRTRLTPRA
jgi:hypothetical protein